MRNRNGQAASLQRGRGRGTPRGRRPGEKPVVGRERVRALPPRIVVRPRRAAGQAPEQPVRVGPAPRAPGSPATHARRAAARARRAAPDEAASPRQPGKRSRAWKSWRATRDLLEEIQDEERGHSGTPALRVHSRIGQEDPARAGADASWKRTARGLAHPGRGAARSGGGAPRRGGSGPGGRPPEIRLRPDPARSSGESRSPGRTRARRRTRGPASVPRSGRTGPTRAASRSAQNSSSDTVASTVVSSRRRVSAPSA